MLFFYESTASIEMYHTPGAGAAHVAVVEIQNTAIQKPHTVDITVYVRDHKDFVCFAHLL